ncbi:DUF882 domain-containing protein [Kaarinaea lacus]
MIKRRDFLKYALTHCTLGAATIVNSPALFAKTKSVAERQLAFYNLHTGEKLTTTYWTDGNYLAAELRSINHLLRDHRSGEVQPIDKQLLDLLYALQQTVEKEGSYHIISGYRSPRTNARLRQQSSGVAKKSLHMLGKAIDVRLPGVDLKHLRQAALSLQLGGVGYYPKSNFVHLDTGRPRFW